MKSILPILGLLISTISLAQNNSTIDSTNFKQLYSYALRGNLKEVFDRLAEIDDSTLNEEQVGKKELYYQRFLYRNEEFDYVTDLVEIIDVYKRFQNYWRSVMIEQVPLDLADSLFRDEMNHYLQKHFKPNLSIEEIGEQSFTLFGDFFASRNLHGTAMGKAGHLYDLYLWGSQSEVDYEIILPEGQTIHVPVVFMRDFICNGWSHYTTFGYSYTGGWATSEKLFCVEESYGPKDEEDFMVSYISHEGQHFSDYGLFPKLKQADLEYRAKLTEVCLAKESLFRVVEKFIQNSKNDKAFAHAYANYMVVRCLSQELFDSDFETNPEVWKKTPKSKISKVALKLLKQHSQKLEALGAETVEAYITTIDTM